MEVIISNLNKGYSGQEVLQDLSLQISNGNITCLLGKNGAGKTTMINCMMEMVEPDSGTIQFDELNMKTHGVQIKKRIGIMGEDNPLIEEFTGKTYLEWIASLYKLNSNDFKDRMKSLTEYFFDDTKVLKKSIASYSTGMKKKIGFIASVMHLPDLLILDEPFSGLDPVAANQMVTFLEQYSSPERSIFLASHDLSYIEKLATHIAVLDSGKILFNDTIQSFTSEGKSQLDEALIEIIAPKTTTLENLNWIKS